MAVHECPLTTDGVSRRSGLHRQVGRTDRVSVHMRPKVRATSSRLTMHCSHLPARICVSRTLYRWNVRGFLRTAVSLLCDVPCVRSGSRGESHRLSFELRLLKDVFDELLLQDIVLRFLYDSDTVLKHERVLVVI